MSGRPDEILSFGKKPLRNKRCNLILNEHSLLTMQRPLTKSEQEIVNSISATANFIPGVIIIHDLPDFTVRYMSPYGLQLLRKEWDEIKGLSNEEYHKRFFNEEDAKEYVPKILDLLEKNHDEVISYFQQVRTSPTSDWDWYMSMTKILARDESQKPSLSITVAMKIDPQHYFTKKATRLLQENEFLKKNYSDFSKLTKREREILALMAKGKSTVEIAELLNISETTAETHRKNLRRKIDISSPYDIYMLAQAFNLV
jgi:DNA-binding CsgD family transcriptional regulator